MTGNLISSLARCPSGWSIDQWKFTDSISSAFCSLNPRGCSLTADQRLLLDWRDSSHWEELLWSRTCWASWTPDQLLTKWWDRRLTRGTSCSMQCTVLWKPSQLTQWGKWHSKEWTATTFFLSVRCIISFFILLLLLLYYFAFLMIICTIISQGILAMVALQMFNLFAIWRGKSRVKFKDLTERRWERKLQEHIYFFLSFFLYLTTRSIWYLF